MVTVSTSFTAITGMYSARMEQKLKEYRDLRRRKEVIQNTKAKLQDIRGSLIQVTLSFLAKMEKEKKEEEKLLMEEEKPALKPACPVEYEESIEPEEDSELESVEEPERPESWQYFIMKWTIYFVIWLTLWIFFLMQGFGAVYFAFSILIGIYFNTSVKKKKPGEASAYSVFNDNCESIDGTLKAEDLQRQILYGLAGLRVNS